MLLRGVPMGFPTIRPRRLRATPELRALVRETTLNAGDFVYPMFFNAAIDAPRPIGSMPGIDQLPLSAARAQAKAIKERGVGSVILFGLPKTKDDRGTSGLDPDGPVPRAIAEMKSAVPELVVMADVCVDEYTEHGHCGVLKKRARRRDGGRQRRDRRDPRERWASSSPRPAPTSSPRAT